MAEREKPPRTSRPSPPPTDCSAARGRATTRSMSPITTRNGACPNTTTARCSRSSSSTASRPALSWITILRKRDAFRAAFDGFEPEKIARYDAAKIEALMDDAGIVRNRAKIEATVALARISLDLAEARRPRAASVELRRRPADPERAPNRSRDIPAESDVSRAIAKDLRAARRQFRRADHRLRLHAGDRHGQRSSRRLSSPRAPAAALAASRAAMSDRRRAARLAADAVGPPARPHRSLAARRRDRRHRPRPGAGRALERPDAWAGDLLGRAAFAAGRGDLFAAETPRAAARARASPRCCTTRPNT